MFVSKESTSLACTHYFISGQNPFSPPSSLPTVPAKLASSSTEKPLSSLKSLLVDAWTILAHNSFFIPPPQPPGSALQIPACIASVPAQPMAPHCPSKLWICALGHPSLLLLRFGLVGSAFFIYWTKVPGERITNVTSFNSQLSSKYLSQTGRNSVNPVPNEEEGF